MSKYTSFVELVRLISSHRENFGFFLVFVNLSLQNHNKIGKDPGTIAALNNVVLPPNAFGSIEPPQPRHATLNDRIVLPLSFGSIYSSIYISFFVLFTNGVLIFS